MQLTEEEVKAVDDYINKTVNSELKQLHINVGNALKIIGSGGFLMPRDNDVIKESIYAYPDMKIKEAFLNLSAQGKTPVQVYGSALNMALTLIRETSKLYYQSVNVPPPEFARFNDDVLFGENWNNADIDIKTRCIITVVSLMSQGICDGSMKHHLQNAKNNGVTKKEIVAAITHTAFYAGWPKGWAVFNLAKEIWNDD